MKSHEIPIPFPFLPVIPGVFLDPTGDHHRCRVPSRYHNAGEYAVLQIWGEVHEVLKAYGVSGEAQARLLESWKTKKGGKTAGDVG